MNIVAGAKVCASHRTTHNSCFHLPHFRRSLQCPLRSGLAKIQLPRAAEVNCAVCAAAEDQLACPRPIQQRSQPLVPHTSYAKTKLPGHRHTYFCTSKAPFCQCFYASVMSCRGFEWLNERRDKCASHCDVSSRVLLFMMELNANLTFCGCLFPELCCRMWYKYRKIYYIM